MSPFSLPVGSFLPGMMEANEVFQCCATGDTAEKWWQRPKKMVTKKEKVKYNRKCGRQKV